MPAFLNRVFRGGGANAKKSVNQTAVAERPTGPKYTDGWLRPEVAPEEVQELLRGCTIEMKARGLLSPFLLLPYRPHSDPCPARAFIRKFFSPITGPLTGAHLQQELRLTEPDVLCSALKWCWSRLPGGVVTWDVYELFRQGEVDSIMARDSFATFIPIGAESEARTKIIFDYFDLLSAIAAHGKHNGLGGLKLSRLAGWWAFEHVDTGYGFEGGYATWTSAADACCHLFFAYLRSLSPSDPSRSVSLLPTSLRALLASVDYPPVTPPQFQTRTVRVIMTVDRVSPSPFALLRRAKNIQYGIGDRALKVFTDFDDPVRALTDECRRVLKCISSTGQSSASGFKLATGAQEQSWSRFQDIGFSGSPDSEDDDDDTLQSEAFARRRVSSQSHSNPTPSTTPRERDEFVEIVRPTTPSWADFMDAGFGDRELQHSRSAASHLLPPDKVLPPIDTADRLKSSQSNRRLQVLEPGELESVKPMDVDDVFWWVWMSSLAGEETPPRKAVFGRCALVETTVQGAKWLVVEEKVRGAAILTESPVATKEKKRWTPKRSKLRRKSLGVTEAPAQHTKPFSAPTHAASRTNIGPDQTAKIQAAAAALRQQKTDAEYGQPRRGGKPREHAPETKTNSVFTLQPVIMSEASPAMKWANRYDRDTMRDAYRHGLQAPEKKPVPAPEKKPVPAPEKKPVPATERSLPALPREETVQSRPEPAPMAAPPGPAKATTVSLPAEPVRQHAPAAVASAANNGRSSPAFSKRMSMSPSPAPSANPLPDKAGKKVSRLRAIFGMKTEGPQPTVVGGGQLVVPSADIGRQNSLRRKNTPIEVQPAQPVSPPPVEAVHSPALEKETAPAYPSPPAPEHHPALAKQSFPAFDQGPLDDQPAFIPEDASEVSDLDTSDIPFRDDQPTPGPSASSASEPAVQDRWAQIRKNAAERAKASKMTDDVSATTTTTDARGSLDDGETSGEETIESRVARIKARVAQLTADGGNNHRA